MTNTARNSYGLGLRYSAFPIEAASYGSVDRREDGREDARSALGGKSCKANSYVDSVVSECINELIHTTCSIMTMPPVT